jgi:hypothetical protein
MVEQKANRLEGGGHFLCRCPSSFQHWLDRGPILDKPIVYALRTFVFDI